MSNRLLASVLRDPGAARSLKPADWNALFAAARAELLFGSLAVRLEGADVPDDVRPILADAMVDAARWRRDAEHEAAMTARALARLPGKVVLMKGTAYVMAGLNAGKGRHVGDIDIMVAPDLLDHAEKALLGHGWSWVKQDAYDDAYYRRWMHELPPLVHEGRDKMADVHHTILPMTHRKTPDAAAMLADAVPVGERRAGEARLHVFAPADMVCHNVAHLIADGDLAGGMRNLWDFHLLFEEFAGADPAFAERLAERAARHELTDEVERAARLSHRLYGTHVPKRWQAEKASDRPFLRRLLARDRYGRQTRFATQQGFYIRSHWMRMPPVMLAKHLMTKARRKNP